MYFHCLEDIFLPIANDTSILCTKWQSLNFFAQLSIHITIISNDSQ